MEESDESAPVRISVSPWSTRGEVLLAPRGPIDTRVEVTWGPAADRSERLLAGLHLLVERVLAEASSRGANRVVGLELEVDPFGSQITLRALASACTVRGETAFPAREASAR
jgi:hypothetical protein